MRTPTLLYAFAFAVRLVVAWHAPDPAYADSAYYVDVARALADGRGMNVDFIWIFAEVGGTLPVDPTLPIPSNAHWMPLASLVQVPFILLLGPTPFASALPFALIGALGAPLTWAIARDAGARPAVALGAGIIAAAPVLTLVFMAQPDNFALFQPLAAGALWLGGRALKGDARAFALAGLLVGLATLSRNDGVLVGAALAIAFGWNRWRVSRSMGGRRAIPIWAAAACVGLFLVVMVPWWARQLDVFGQLSPSTTSGKVLFIRSIAEWNSITTPATLDHLLGQGLGALVASRVGGLVAALGILAVLICGLFLVPFLAVGAWARRRSPVFGLFFVYGALLLAFSAAVSAVHVPGGTFIHSAVALAPHVYVLALEGIGVAVAYATGRRASWRAAEAERVFVGAAVALAIVIAAAGMFVVHGRWAMIADDRRAVGAALDAHDPDRADRIMSIDAAGYRYHTNRGGVVLVNDPLQTIRDVAAAYDVRWLVLERSDAVSAVEPILRGLRPPWVGSPILERTDATDPRPRVAVYPVCLGIDDDRCEAAS